MALPVFPNTITMSQIAAELGISATGLSLNDSRVRALAGRPSGNINFSDLHGKSAFTATHVIGVAQNGSTERGFNIYVSPNGTINPGTASNGQAINNFQAIDTNGFRLVISGADMNLYNRMSIKDSIQDIVLSAQYTDKTNEVYYTNSSVPGIYAAFGAKLNTTMEIRLFKV